MTYALREDNALVIRYQMESDADTICNLTNHAYFNLDGHGAQTAMEQEVCDRRTKRYSPADQYSIPAGELAPVQGTPMDFTRFKPIAQDIAASFDQLTMAGGYDHNWVLDHPTGALFLSAAALACLGAEDGGVGPLCPAYNFTPEIISTRYSGRRAGRAFATRAAIALRPNTILTPSTTLNSPRPSCGRGSARRHVPSTAF